MAAWGTLISALQQARNVLRLAVCECRRPSLNRGDPGACAATSALASVQKAVVSWAAATIYAVLGAGERLLLRQLASMVPDARREIGRAAVWRYTATDKCFILCCRRLLTAADRPCEIDDATALSALRRYKVQHAAVAACLAAGSL
jgi:hypothetical protein